MTEAYPLSPKRIFRPLLWLAASVTLIGLTLTIQPAGATSPALQATSTPVTQVLVRDEDCLACHSQPEMYLPLPSGEQLLLTLDTNVYHASIHAQKGYACVQCHTNITGFPHPEFNAVDRRDAARQLSATCTDCHAQAGEEYAEGLHAEAWTEGNQDSAVCSDCHGAHEVQPFGDSHFRIAQTCRQCHAEIYDVYAESVHGAALLQEFNPDVPTCVDCHDHHRNAGPTRAGFHLFSPQLCAQCHSDTELMARYDINTNVFETYVADFHGTTVTLFEKTAPDQETNKPVCIDCHGVHDIRSPEDVGSTVIKQNLITTCRRCHEDATPAFSEAWLGHYEPDLQRNAPTFLVNVFYGIFIPGLIGGMGLYVALDYVRHVLGRRRKRGVSHE
jgi:nitrate/TMAO reductase-like tetraheme cytochrome c subunit